MVDDEHDEPAEGADDDLEDDDLEDEDLEEDDEDDAPAPTCRCGHTVDDKAVIPYPRYSVWGQISLIVVGITASPKRVDFVCTRCRETVHSARDPETLRRFTN